MIDKQEILKQIKVVNNIGVSDESYDDVIYAFIDVAIGTLLELRYPFDLEKDVDDLEDRWNSWIFRATKSIYDNQGSYNILKFSQNGVSVTYGELQDGIEIGLINAVVPKAGAPR